MTDPVDAFAVDGLKEYRGKPLVSAMAAEIELDAPAGSDTSSSTSTSFLEHVKTLLADRVSDVRPSRRLTDSPACLVIPEGGLAPHIERLLRARQMNVPPVKRVLEINPDHGILRSLGALYQRDPSSAKLRDYVEVLFDQALLAEGSPVPSPALFARRIAELLSLATERDASSNPGPAAG
jgi:molecular chaperone HtpG